MKSDFSILIIKSCIAQKFSRNLVLIDLLS